ncbi:hypothetical protein R3P38DRAFT_3566420 [Favolaschia claudopus]|uniref:Uncharacterized protein n=1 Tax=Favolaschia claudopus TaxID=2862362 RepID=A0AAW0DXJ6_9AGAR
MRRLNQNVVCLSIVALPPSFLDLCFDPTGGAAPSIVFQRQNCPMKGFTDKEEDPSSAWKWVWLSSGIGMEGQDFCCLASTPIPPIYPHLFSSLQSLGRYYPRNGRSATLQRLVTHTPLPVDLSRQRYRDTAKKMHDKRIGGRAHSLTGFGLPFTLDLSGWIDVARSDTPYTRLCVRAPRICFLLSSISSESRARSHLSPSIFLSSPYPTALHLTNIPPFAHLKLSARCCFIRSGNADSGRVKTRRRARSTATREDSCDPAAVPPAPIRLFSPSRRWSWEPERTDGGLPPPDACARARQSAHLFGGWAGRRHAYGGGAVRNSSCGYTSTFCPPPSR